MARSRAVPPAPSERVLENIRRDASISRDDLIEVLEEPGGYRDMERGAVSFWEFYDFICEKTGYRGSIRDLHNVWSDFFDGPLPGVGYVHARRARTHGLRRAGDVPSFTQSAARGSIGDHDCSAPGTV